MRESILPRFLLALLTSLVVLLLSSSTFGAATIVIQNNDAAGVGFNDPTAVAPVGGNPGTTLGQQRLNAFQYAANIWGAILTSNSTITVRASWSALSCTSNTAVLGSAGAATISANFPNAPFSDTWYSAALANSLRGSDPNTATPEINANFNVNLGNPGCFDGTHFYLGLDNNHGSDIDLVTVLLHEFSHGFGYQSFTNADTGTLNQGLPSIFDRFLFDNNTNKTWADPTMTNTDRHNSALSVNKLAWSGAQVTTDVHNVLATPLLKINSPAGIAGNYAVGTATFGAHLSSPGVTANVATASPTDACTPLINGAGIAGRITLIDRGTCTFIVKVKNAQNAGALAVIVADNQPGPVVGMGGTDGTITIPSVRITQSDGNTIKGQLGSGVNATVLVNTAMPSGVDAQSRALMYAPSTFSGGSSVSHWDLTEYPNQLMEPDISGDLTHSVAPVNDLTVSLFRDIGWKANPIGDTQFFVRQQYRDFLNREPDSSGLAFWIGNITSCGLDQACNEVKHINVSAAFFLSIEFQETGYLVYRFYKASYGDGVGNSTLGGFHQFSVPVVRLQDFLPDTQQIGQGVQVGIGNWQQQLENNKQAFAAAFVQRPVFTAAYPTGFSPAQFVDTLFANAEVIPSGAERQAAIDEFGGASTTTNTAARGRALRRVAENATLNTQELSRAFVMMQYFGYLRRNPNDTPDADYTGYDFWLTKLNQFNGNFVTAEMVKAFISSTEYRGRFGP